MQDDENFDQNRVGGSRSCVAAALATPTTSAFAQAPAPTPWELKSDTGYAYGKDGKTFATRWAPTMPASC